MSKIIVATDFSESSHNALLHALSLANHCGSDLCMVWVKKSDTEKDKFDSKTDSDTKVITQFEELILQYGPELPNNIITYKIRSGKVFKEIVDEAKESNAILIITGTHGASVFVEFWIGSNANRIISLAHCPVITIRAGIDIQRPLKRILLPIDSTLETRQKASFAAFLAKKHNAEIHVVSVYTSNLKDVKMKVDLYANQVSEFLEKEGIKHAKDGIKADHFSTHIIEYAQKVDANLIALMKDQEYTASNLWMGPITQQIVNHSPIPVLVIQSKNTQSGGLGF
jgi:nucleotide-binding universal stress UspA family protein